MGDSQYRKLLTSHFSRFFIASCLSPKKVVSLYTRRAYFSPNCEILSDFVKSAFLRNHRKPLVLKDERLDSGRVTAHDGRAEFDTWRHESVSESAF